MLLSVLGLVCLGGFAYWGYGNYWHSGTAEITDVPTVPVKMMTIWDKVVEQGKLESQSTVNGICEIDRWDNKIIFLAPEGKLVKKGQVVCEFDRTEFEKEINAIETQVNEAKSRLQKSEQELIVQKDENEKSIRAAKQAMEFAKLDLEKYVNGDYEVNKSDIKGTISESQTAVDKARRDMENTRVLVKRGFRELEQLREAEQVLKSAELRLTRDKQKLVTLEKFEHVKSLAEFKGKHVEAKENYEVAKTTAQAKLIQAQDSVKNAKRGLKIQEDRLVVLKKQLDKHTMRAPQDGTLAYAENRYEGGKINASMTIHQNQTVFVLPDMTRMQVKVGVHESLVSKVKPKQKVIIHVDAFSGTGLRGTVKSVSPLSASTRWEPSNNYHVLVTIDEFPSDMKLKPGMTAEVEILVGQYSDVLAVPIQAVANFGNKNFVFAQNESGEINPQEVTLGNSNVSYVEVTSGLEQGQIVTLDAYQRSLLEFGDEEPVNDDVEELSQLAADANNADADNATDKTESATVTKPAASTSETLAVKAVESTPPKVADSETATTESQQSESTAATASEKPAKVEVATNDSQPAAAESDNAGSTTESASSEVPINSPQ